MDGDMKPSFMVGVVLRENGTGYILGGLLDGEFEDVGRIMSRGGFKGSRNFILKTEELGTPEIQQDSYVPSSAVAY